MKIAIMSIGIRFFFSLSFVGCLFIAFARKRKKNKQHTIIFNDFDKQAQGAR